MGEEERKGRAKNMRNQEKLGMDGMEQGVGMEKKGQG